MQKSVASIHGLWLESRVLGRGRIVPRRSLFTPHRVAGGPGKDQKLNKSRTTSGIFVASGEKFKIVDSYTEPRAAHMMLEHAWTGTTEFQEIAKPIDNISNHERYNTNPSKWADMGLRGRVRG